MEFTIARASNSQGKWLASYPVVRESYSDIRYLKKTLKSHRVQSPLDGCHCTYEMYGCVPSERERNVTILQERLKREHPDHTSEVLGVNEFRKVPK